MSVRASGLLLAALGMVGCGKQVHDADQARQEVQDTGRSVSMVTQLLGLLGILPKYECGEAQRDVAGRLSERLHLAFSCAEVSTTQDETSDAVLLTMGRCGWMDGVIRANHSGGEDRHAVDLDLRELSVNHTPVPVQLGYEGCGDQARYWAKAEAQLRSDAHFAFDLGVTVQEGVVLVGGTNYILDGTGALTNNAGKDALTFSKLAYRTGELTPHAGSMTLETEDGHLIEASFDEESHLATVRIDRGKSFQVPVVE